MADVVIVAGEASGDQLAAALVEQLREVDPSLRFYGVCGPYMRKAGVEPWFDIATLSVRGYVEVLAALPRILRLRRALIQKIAAQRPAIFIGVDAPDFNLRVERQVKALGIPTAHYVCPSFWAWRPERAKKFSESMDHMLCVFPFETALLAKHNVTASFVGHSLVRTLEGLPERGELRRRYAQYRNEDEIGELIAMLPGSRVSELNYHAELFADTLALVAREKPNARFLVPLIDRETRTLFEAALWKNAAQYVDRVELMFAHAGHALRAADVALIASGTASLEGAIHGCPHLVTYRISALTYRMVKRKLLLPYVALPNILAKERIVPEHLQQDATAPRLAKGLVQLLDDNLQRKRMKDSFAMITESLKPPSENAFAKALFPLMRNRRL